MERHHIVFKSQMGLDFELNYKYLTPEEHRGKNGPHMNRETDLKYKRDLAEVTYKTAKDMLQALQSQLSGLQTLYKRQDEI